VHSTIASFAALPGVVAKIERGTPFLLTEHGVYARERYIAVSGADFPFYAKRYLLQLTALISRVCYRYADVVRRWRTSTSGGSCATARARTRSRRSTTGSTRRSSSRAQAR
jgi:hypothetical protein